MFISADVSTTKIKINVIKDWKDIFRIHGNKDFGSNWSGKFDEYTSVLHILDDDLIDGLDKEIIPVIFQSGISKRYPDYRKDGFMYRHKVMYSRLMTYIEAEAQYGSLQRNFIQTLSPVYTIEEDN